MSLFLYVIIEWKSCIKQRNLDFAAEQWSQPSIEGSFFAWQCFVEAAAVSCKAHTWPKTPIGWRTTSKNSSVFKTMLIPVCDVFTVLLTKLLPDFATALILLDLYYSWNSIDIHSAIPRILTVDKSAIMSTLQTEWKDSLGLSDSCWPFWNSHVLYYYCDENFSSHRPAPYMHKEIIFCYLFTQPKKRQTKKKKGWQHKILRPFYDAIYLCLFFLILILAFIFVLANSLPFAIASLISFLCSAASIFRSL